MPVTETGENGNNDYALIKLCTLNIDLKYLRKRICEVSFEEFSVC